MPKHPLVFDPPPRPQPDCRMAPQLQHEPPPQHFEPKDTGGICIDFLGCKRQECRSVAVIYDGPTNDGASKRFGEDEGLCIWYRFRIHLTPKHASWLNQAETEISIFSRQCLGRRRFESLAFFAKEASAWEKQVNRQRRSISWRFITRCAQQVFKGEGATTLTRPGNLEHRRDHQSA